MKNNKNNNKTVFGLAVLSSFALAMALPISASAVTLSRQLEMGMRGVDVGDLQTFLALDSSIYPSGLVTGYFGTLTKGGVMRFQARNGISTVGRVGPQTLAVINAQMGGVAAGGTVFAGFSGVSVSPSSTSVNFSIGTDMPVRAAVHYSTSPVPASEVESQGTVTVGGTQAPVSNTLQTTHYITANGLQPNTTYHYVVHVVNANGKSSVLFGRFTTSN